MVRSMTGYGTGEYTGPRHCAKVECRAVNHRYCEVAPRIPRIAASLEEKVRKAVQARVERGRVDVFIDLKKSENDPKQVKVDNDLAAAYHSALRDMQEKLGLSGTIELGVLVELPGVVGQSEAEEDLDLLWDALEAALERSLDGLIAMREREGNSLEQDISRRLGTVGALVSQIEERALVIVDEYRRKLESRINEILTAGALDETRLAMEVALYADRSNIDEETVRISSHLKQFREALKSGGAVGRKLDFLLQEINREVNTIGSKASDARIGTVVVEVKSELEKIREQIQNIE